MSSSQSLEQFDALIKSLNTVIFGEGDVILNGQTKPTISKFLKSMASNGWYEEPYKTETALLASTPIKSKAIAKALDTKNIFYWDGTSWSSAGKSDFDLFSDIVNSVDIFPTTPILVSSAGEVTIPPFYSARLGVLKRFESTYVFKPEQSSRFYALYYDQDINNIVVSSTSYLPKAPNLCLVGVAYSGKFITKLDMRYSVENDSVFKYSNDVYNGSLNPSLPIDSTVYAYNTTSNDNAVVEAVEDEYLKSIGISRMQKLVPTGVKGGFGEAPLFERRIKKMSCVVSTIVYDPTGEFNFGSGGVVSYYSKTDSNGENLVNYTTIQMGNFYQLSPKVRQYYFTAGASSLSQTQYPDSYISRALVGARVGADAPRPLWVGGYWVSIHDGSRSYGNGSTMRDTYFPDFSRVSTPRLALLLDAMMKKKSSEIGELSNGMSSIGSRVAELERMSRPMTDLENLKDDLYNGMMSVNIKLVGDSITWGSGASNASATNPRNGTLSDPRNTTDPSSPSWANLLRQWLISTFSNGQITHSGGGVGYSEEISKVVVSENANRFKYRREFYNTSWDATSIMSLITTANVESGEYLDLIPYSYPSVKPNELEFETNSDFTLVHAKLNFDNSGSAVNVYSDGVLFATVDVTASVATFNNRTEITLPKKGKQKIIIKNMSTTNNTFRLQHIEFKRVVKVSNDGINGASTKSWLNLVKLSDSIKESDDYVIVQLGTNDRITSSGGTLRSFYDNLVQIRSDILKYTNNKARMIVMSANDVTQDQSSSSPYYCTMADINKVVASFAKSYKVSFISNFSATTSLRIGDPVYDSSGNMVSLSPPSYLKDGLHPNDRGYYLIFENIKKHIMGV